MSDPFYFLNDANNRKTFVDSAEEFLRTWKFFDGIDIDWEYPGGGGANGDLGDPLNGGNTYLLLMQELRAMLDGLSNETGRDYQLTSAIGAGRTKIEKIDYAAVSAVIDNIFLMSYDYYGGWDLNTLGHMSGVNPPAFRTDDQQTQDFTVVGGLDLLAAQGASPLTGTATGPVAGTWEPGVVDYKAIAEFEKDGTWVKGYDETAQAPYIYKQSTGDLISYDDVQSVMAKGALVKQRNLAGLFSWEIDVDNGDILNAMHESLGHGDTTGNNAPIARAGVDQVVNPTTQVTVTLDGSNSTDADAEALTYAWTQTSGTAVTLLNANSAVASFVQSAVDTQVTLTFNLTVSDGKDSNSDTVNVVVESGTPVNHAPTISLPADMSVDSQASFSVAANAADPDGDAITVTWVVSTGLQVVSSNESGLSGTAPQVTKNTGYTVTATVSDGVLSAPDSVVVTVKAPIGDCDATDPDSANHPAWAANITYNGGETVSHTGLVFKAKWWNQANEPTTGEGPWALVSSVSLPWDAATVYVGGDEVNHQGTRYRAQYWTKNAEPGVADIWTDVGAATCP